MSLSSITHNTTVQTAALVLGITSPRVITRRDATVVHLATLLLADESLPAGLTLEIWAAQALTVLPLRVLDVVTVRHIYRNANVFRLRYQGSIKRGGRHNLTAWGRQAHPELFQITSVRAAEWTANGRARAPVTLQPLPLDVEGRKVWPGVTVEKVFIKTRRLLAPSVAVVRSIIGLQCVQCQTILPNAGTRKCTCGALALSDKSTINSELCRVVWGMCVLQLRVEDQQVLVFVRGEHLAAILFHISPQEAMKHHHVAAQVLDVFKCLVRDRVDVVVQKNSAVLPSVSWELKQIIVANDLA